MSTRPRRSKPRTRGHRPLPHVIVDHGAEVIVCLPGDDPRFFTDNVHTTCANCGINVYHRPYVSSQAIKLCIDCALVRLRVEEVAS